MKGENPVPRKERWVKVSWKTSKCHGNVPHTPGPLYGKRHRIARLEFGQQHRQGIRKSHRFSIDGNDDIIGLQTGPFSGFSGNKRKSGPS